MYYYAKEDDVRALGYIPLHGNVLKKHTYTAEEPGKYLFEILPGKGGVCRFNLSINFPACVDALDGMLACIIWIVCCLLEIFPSETKWPPLIPMSSALSSLEKVFKQPTATHTCMSHYGVHLQASSMMACLHHLNRMLLES